MAFFKGSAGITFDKLTTKNLQVESSILNNKFNVKDLVLIHGRKYTFDSLELTEDTLIQDLQVSRSANLVAKYNFNSFLSNIDP